MLELAKGANLALAFALELAMLTAFASWALSLGLPAWQGWGLALLLVAAAVVLWSIWAAPRSARRLGEAALTLFKLALFALAALALVAAGQAGWGIGFAVLAAASLVLARVWAQ